MAGQVGRFFNSFGLTVAFSIMVIVSLMEQPKTNEELHGLVYGMEIKDRSEVGKYSWYRSPFVLGMGVLALNAALYVGLYVV